MNTTNKRKYDDRKDLLQTLSLSQQIVTDEISPILNLENISQKTRVSVSNSTLNSIAAIIPTNQMKEVIDLTSD